MAQVVNSTPAAGAREVDITTDISAQFDADVLASSVNAETFLLYNRADVGVTIPGTVTYDATTRIATFNPTGPLIPEAEYAAVIVAGESGILFEELDPYGEHVQLSEQYYWSFITNDGRFAPPPIEGDADYVAPAPDGTPIPSGFTTVYPVGADVDYATPFAVLETSPEHQSSNMYYASSGYIIPVGGFSVQTKFNKFLHPNVTIPAAGYQVVATPVMGDTFTPAEGVLTGTIAASGQWLTFTPDNLGTMLANNRFHVTIDKDLVQANDGTQMSDDYEFYFTSWYDPFYIGADQVRMRIGPYIKQVPDDTINQFIHQNSLIAYYLGHRWAVDKRPWNTVNYTYVQKVWREGFSVLRTGDSGWGVDYIYGPPEYVKQFVLAKTLADVLNAVFTEHADSISRAGGGGRKRLGDLDISKAGNALYAYTIGPMLKRLEGDSQASDTSPLLHKIGEIEYWKRIITGEAKWKSPAVARRGANVPETNVKKRTWDERGLPDKNMRTPTRRPTGIIVA